MTLSYYGTGFAVGLFCMTKSKILTRLDRMMKKLLALITLCASLSANAELQNIKTLLETTQQFADAHFFEVFAEAAHAGDLAVNVGKVDPRLKLATCDDYLTFEIRSPRPNASNGSIKTSCLGEKPWSLYIPYTLDIYRDVIVTSEHLSKGQIIRAQDVEIQRRNITSLKRAFFSDAHDIIGKVATRKISPGAVIHEHLTRFPQIVTKGDHVTVIAKTSGFEVSTMGVALNNGAKGEQVRVRNLKSNKVVPATVVGPKRLHVYGIN